MKSALFPSTLVINGSSSDIDKLLATLGHIQVINNPDIFEVTEYTIATIREINKFLATKPLSHNNKAILIRDADKLNFESQNALLKSLEEPGKDNYFILSTHKPFGLLPTITSRCQQIRYQSSNSTSGELLRFPATVKEKLIQSETLSSDRESTIAYLESQLTLFQKELIDSPSPTNLSTIKKLIKTISLIKANVDPKTAIDYLLLSN